MTVADDQVAAFVNGLPMPLDPIPDVHLAIILEAISSAWQAVRSSGSTVPQTGDEKNVTTMLGNCLHNLCQAEPLFKDLVKVVARGVESINFDATRIELRPDLSIYLTDPKRPFPLIVECKLIDHPNQKGVGLYCTNGIARFVCGDYAWTNREGIMLAYVRDGSTIATKLTPHLANNAKLTPDPLQTLSHPKARADMHPTVHQSRHCRSFPYNSLTSGAAPGPITLFHLWL